MVLEAASHFRVLLSCLRMSSISYHAPAATGRVAGVVVARRWAATLAWRL